MLRCALLTLGATAALEGGRRPFNITEAQGSLSFADKGSFVAEANFAVLFFDIDSDQLAQRMFEFGALVEKRMDGDWNAARWVAVQDEYHVTAHQFLSALQVIKSAEVQAEKEEQGRQPKSFWTWIASAFGLLNTVDVAALHQRVNHEEAAIRQTVHTVDALADVFETMVKEQRALDDAMQMRNSMSNMFAYDVGLLWRKLKGKVDAFMEVTMAALHHELHPAIHQLVDVGMEWDVLKGKLHAADWVVHVEDWLHLFQLKISFGITRGRVRIAVPVPISAKDSPTLRLLEWRRRPLVVAGHIVEVATQERFIAWDEATGASVAISKTELEECTAIAGTTLCAGSMVRYTSEAGTCLRAVLHAEWQDIQSHCPLIIRPLESEARAVGHNKFEVLTAKKTPLIVRCETGSEVADFIPAGAHLLEMEDGCVASTFEWTTLRGVKATPDLVVEVGVNFLREESLNFTKPLEINAPQPVQHAREAVEKQLTGYVSIWVWVAVALGIAGIVGLAAFILSVYMKARFGQSCFSAAEAA